MGIKPHGFRLDSHLNGRFPIVRPVYLYCAILLVHAERAPYRFFHTSNPADFSPVSRLGPAHGCISLSFARRHVPAAPGPALLPYSFKNIPILFIDGYLLFSTGRYLNGQLSTACTELAACLR
jgi:hypothetical protein